MIVHGETGDYFYHPNLLSNPIMSDKIFSQNFT